MSWLWSVTATDPNAPTFHPVSTRFTGSDLVGELAPRDSEWTCAGGFVTETQTFYNVLEGNIYLMCQVVHSSVGVWYPTVQFNMKLYYPETGELVWRTANVTNFVTPPPGLDKRSCKSDQFSISFKSKPNSATPESYIIQANVSDDAQVSIEIARPAAVPGWKIGKGPKGGYSYYGTDPENADGYMIHRFWPRTQASGLVILRGKAITAEGPGMFVHAIMGLRPNLVATRWNFANFQSLAHGGVSAIQMELTTPEAYGRRGAGSGGVKVNIGSIVLGGKLVTVTAETTWPDEEPPKEAEVTSRAYHLNTIVDPETSYAQPTVIEYVWSGPSLVPDAPGKVSASTKSEVGTPDAPKGLIEKVDVLAEIPAVVKAVISYVAGTKPYIYQWMTKTTLSVKAPDALLPGASEGLDIEGVLINEASFISP